MPDFSLLPLWRITGTLTLQTPLHVGSGLDEDIDVEDARTGALRRSTVAGVVRDARGQPCIPGAGFKGALNELARRCGLDVARRQRLFGAELARDDTSPAAVEFEYLYLEDGAGQPSPGHSQLPHFGRPGHAGAANVPHGVRNRATGTAEEQLLFLEQVVPPGSRFDFVCTARGIDQDDVESLLGLLELAGGSGSPLRLGAGKSADNGRVAWCRGEVRRIDRLAGAWQAVVAANGSAVDIWSDTASAMVEGLQPAPLHPPPDWIRLDDLELRFHTPFLVYHRVNKLHPDDPDGAPRTNHQGQGILPASSLHGALRSQAERILRTLGAETPEGYRVPAVRGVAAAAACLDLASLLFGAPGWRSLVRCSDFVVEPPGTLLTQELIAIDRITGGGRDGAKYNIRAYDCPVLRGHIQLDARRLRLAAQAAGRPTLANEVLGLLVHVLRDLDEGDIALGFGSAKGYGRCCSDAIAALRAGLQAPPTVTLDEAMQAFVDFMRPPGTDLPMAGAAVVDAAASDQQAAQSAVPAPPQHAAAEEFHNPYVFIPFGTPKRGHEKLPWVEHQALGRTRGADATHHGHHRYAAQALHGRLVCRLETRTPLFIGAGDVHPQPDDGGPAVKKNFRLGGHLALPATSLRGLVSSLHESLTASALRVMDERSYSFRQQTGGNEVNIHASSAIGRLHVRTDAQGHEQWAVEPLTLPTLDDQDGLALSEGYRRCFFRAPTPPAGATAFGKVLLRQNLAAPPGSDFARARASSFSCDSNPYHRFWYLPLAPLAVTGHAVIAARGALYFKNGRYAIGQLPSVAGAVPLSQAEWEQLPAAQRAGWVRGFLRTMAYEGRQMPPVQVRHYEVFVPCPDLPAGAKRVAVPCTPDCIDRFRALAEERFDTQRKRPPSDRFLLLPYAPLQHDRADRSDLRPKQGDLVFFKPQVRPVNGLPRVVIAEISFSSIWRGRLETKDPNGRAIAYTTSAALPNPDLAPLGSSGPQRPLSPTELVFGAVEARPKVEPAQDGRPAALAFASKVVVGFGRHQHGEGDDRLANDLVPLKILASPKPPSPAMYFKASGKPGAYVSKADLAEAPSDHKLMGRKVYLHALRDDQGNVQKLGVDGRSAQAGGIEPWRSRNGQDDVSQKARIRPIDKGTFYFEVDFSNLSQPEVASLCACLMPNPSYEHKVGMGKPIGLGSVKVDVQGMYLVDRVARYLQRTLDAAPRYAQAWEAPGSTADLWPVHLRPSALVPAHAAATPQQLAAQHMSALRQEHPAVHRAVLLSGHPRHVVAPVHYPQLAGLPIETETYEWFVNNDKTGAAWPDPPQALRSIVAGSAELPRLSRRARQQQQQPRNRRG